MVNQYVELPEGDQVVFETIFEKVFKRSKKLKTYAKKNDFEVFTNSIYPKIFEEVAQECYEEQMDAFKKLVEDKTF